MRRFEKALSVCSLAFVLVCGSAIAKADEGFAVKDGDRVVFYGDSITDQRLYTTFAESYIVTRFPSMNVSFVHSGWGGDRVTGGGGGPIDHRLARDVFAYKPTVVSVMLGMNDASYQPFKKEIFDVYSNGYAHMVESLQKNAPGVRLTLIVPSPFDDVTRPPSFEKGYNAVLLQYGEFVKELAKKSHADVADLNTSVVDSLKKAVEIDKDKATRLIEDRVHPGPGGQLLMAEALLKAWKAPALVSNVELDASTAKATKAENAKVSDVQNSKGLAWTSQEAALPMPINLKDEIVALAVKASDVEQALNQETLKVTGLKGGKYALKIDGQPAGELTSEQLASGVNLALLETPMMNQAMHVHNLTLKHNDIHFMRWRMVQVPNENEPLSSLAKAMEGLDSLEADVVSQQREAAKPKAHRFELAPLG